MSNQLELFEIVEPLTIDDVLDLYESHEEFEIRQALESGDLKRVNQLLDLKGSNSYM